MKKIEFLNSTQMDLADWQKKFKSVIESQKSLSPKMQSYLLRQIDENAVQSLENFLKRRTNVILYLNEVGDFTESQIYSEEETKIAIDLLLPEDFDSEKDCLYCLKSFTTQGELQRHYEKCVV